MSHNKNPKKALPAGGILCLLALALFSFGFNRVEKKEVDETAWFLGFLNYYSHDSRFAQPSAHSADAAGSLFSPGGEDSLTTAFPKDTLKIKDTLKVIDTLVVDEKGKHADSLKGKKDSVIVIDSMKIDSTARLQHFKVKRRDVPNINFYTGKASKFFSQPTQQKRTIEIDSSGEFVVIKEKVSDVETRQRLKLPLRDYLDLKVKTREQEMWDELVYKYELKGGKRDLSNVLKDITDFEIPLPSVGVLSIFGTPKISLRIGGAVDIHGAWRNETTEGVTASRLGNTRNEPDFRQQVQINVAGTIGDKLQINADWNTERTFEYENQLKIKYTGYEDEIIQSIEAGNVSLQTSNLVGGSEALFGIKANMKMGPLNLTALASQKKGEVKEKIVSGGSSEQTFTVRAYDYSKSHYFLDSVYADTVDPALNIFNKFYGPATSILTEKYVIKDIEVWKSINQIRPDPNERKVNAFIDLPNRFENTPYSTAYRNDSVQEVPGKTFKGRFVRLIQNQDYILHKETGYITFKGSLQETDVIAVAYQYENDLAGTADDKFYGEFLAQAGADTSQRLVLKLIKPPNLQPSYKEAWNLLLKNIYPLGVRDVKREGFVLDIKYEASTGDPQPILGNVRLLNAFGLDKFDQSDNAAPDGLFDFKPGKTINPESGEIIFPTLQPFGRSLPASLENADSLRYNDVYDTSITFAKLNKVKDKFIITGKSSGSSSSTYQLGFQIVENSVRVSLNGRELVNGVDYSVDYTMGSLTIRNEAALVPGANLKISYEENDLFQLASKTLFGLRGMIDISKNTKLGFSMLTLSQQTLSDKVRIGEEPLSNSIYGLDFVTQADLPIVTKLIDKIISTKDASNISFRGEVAMMNPDPNTKKSSVASDGGENIAYIDDFEGSKRIIPIGIGYTSWKDLSIPTSLNPSIERLSAAQKMAYKGKSFWFNILPSDVNVRQVWPEKKVAQGDEAVTVLDYVFMPDTPGTYNYNPDLSMNKEANFGGVMKMLSSTANNLVEENIEFIEFWAQVREAPANARLSIDIGRVSEEVIQNKKLDSEDKNLNELIDNNEDTGLDGLIDADERNAFAKTDSDPSRDNFVYRSSSSYNPMDYFNINGTEGNAALTDVGRFPDTEDLNRNSNLDEVNSYFRYEIPLDTNSQTNPYVVGGGGRNDRWFLYRIPLKDFRLKVNDPSFTVVEMIRMFVTGVSQRVHIRMTEFNLVGNQWRRQLPEDTVMKVSVVNIEDNPAYISPGGVQRERDRSRPDQEVFKNEQALNLIINNLQEGENRLAVKDLFRPLDVFNYSQMKLFLHPSRSTGPSSIAYYKDLTEYASDAFFRFGTDSNNYYEYQAPLRDNPLDSNWMEIAVVFSELTAIKQARDSANYEFKIPVAGKEGHYYVVRGNPSLTQIRFLAIGIRNKSDQNALLQQPVHGELWVNELRVIGADDTKGWAYNAAVSLKLADLMTVNLNVARTDPYFHRLSERFGSRAEANSWGISLDVDLMKFLPMNSQESNLKLNYSRTETIGKPLYLPSTDIKVDEAARLYKEKLIRDTIPEAEATRLANQIVSDAQTVNISDTWSLANIKLKIPTNFWLIKETWNNLTFGFNYNKSFSRNPSVLMNRNWQWNATMGYALSIPEFSFAPIDIPIVGGFLAFLTDYKNYRIYYLPQSFTYNLAARRTRTTNVTRAFGNSSSQENTAREFGSTRGMNLGWKMTDNGFFNISTTYGFDVSSSLTYLETDQFNLQRPESKIWREILTSAFFGKDIQFSQNFDLRTNPKLPSLWDINKNFTLTAGYNVRYQWSSDLSQPELGRSAGYSNRSTVGLTLRLKSLLEPLFKQDAAPQGVTGQSQTPQSRGRDFGESGFVSAPGGQQAAAPTDTSHANDSSGVKKVSALTNALQLLKTFAFLAFVDYDNIRVSFSNENQMSSSGVRGTGTGIKNFFGVSTNVSNGPPRLFMLGLQNVIGERAPRGNLSDNYSQRNSLDFSTSKPLWEGARVDLTWKVGWSLNKSTSLTSDSLGRTNVTNITSTGTVNRSFLSLPPVLIFSVFKSGIKRVNELYDPNSPNPSQSLSDAFVTGFETFPWLSKVPFLKNVVNYIPRPNWRLTWDGLEKFIIFRSFAKRVSLDHSYSSDYNEGWKLNPDGSQVVQSQKITLGFQPLVGLNMTFIDVWNGNFSGNLKYSTRSGFDLGNSTKNISEDFARDIGATLSFTKSGFEIPLFGISLKNDFEFSFSYTGTKNSTVLYDFTKFNEKGTPQNGTNRTTLEPRVKYVISSRVTLSIFYKRSTTEPEGAATIPPTTTNEAGLDIRISIQ